MLPGHPQFSWVWRNQAADRTLHINREQLWWMQEGAAPPPLTPCQLSYLRAGGLWLLVCLRLGRESWGWSWGAVAWLHLCPWFELNDGAQCLGWLRRWGPWMSPWS